MKPNKTHFVGMTELESLRVIRRALMGEPLGPAARSILSTLLDLVIKEIEKTGRKPKRVAKTRKS